MALAPAIKRALGLIDDMMEALLFVLPALDFGSAIAVDGAGNAYLTGSTGTDSFPGVSWVSIQPTYGGDGDAFVIKVNSAGNGIVYSTFLGGTGDDYGTGIAVDASGNAYVERKSLVGSLFIAEPSRVIGFLWASRRLSFILRYYRRMRCLSGLSSGRFFPRLCESQARLFKLNLQ